MLFLLKIPTPRKCKNILNENNSLVKNILIDAGVDDVESDISEITVETVSTEYLDLLETFER